MLRFKSDTFYKYLKTYQLNIIKKKKKDCKKNLVKNIKVFPKKKKKKSNNMVENLAKTSQKMKNKLVEYRQKYYRMRKNALS